MSGQSKETMPTNLPAELIYKILCLLPVKSLIRFKIVSKSWKSIVEDPDFVKSRKLQQPEEPKQLIMKLVGRPGQFLLRELDALDNAKFVNMPMHRRYQRITLIGSCNGLVTLYCYSSNFGVQDFVIWNIATGEHLIVPIEFPLPCARHDFKARGFGYDHVGDDYKVVAILGTFEDDLVTMVYSLKKHEWVWSTSPSSFHIDSDGTQDNPSQVNGALHWAAEENEVQRPWAGYITEPIIVAFDLNTEECCKVPLPAVIEDDDDLEDFIFRVWMTVWGEWLSMLFYNGDPEGLDIWVMKNYVVKESWTKIYSIKLERFVNFVANSRTLLLLQEEEDDDEEDSQSDRLYWYDPLLKEEVRMFEVPTSEIFSAITCVDSLTQINFYTGSKGKRGKPVLKRRKKRKQRPH